MAEQYELKRETGDQYIFHLKVNDGKIILKGEGFPSKRNAMEGIRFVQIHCHDDRKYRRRQTHNLHYSFDLIEAEDEVIAYSGEFPNEQAMEQNIFLLKQVACNAPVVDLTIGSQ